MVLAAVFPGQGSQSVGMLAALTEGYETARDTFAEASRVLDYDLERTVAEGPPELLDRTDVTQPALLAAGIAVWRVWLARGGARPAVLAGHSLGEYTALVASGSLDFADALRLVRRRGEFMQEAVAPGDGAMAAILGLDVDQVAALCADAPGVVAPANLNAPGQTVVAGTRTAVEEVGRRAGDAGAKRVVPLAVSVPSHCPLMQPAADRLARELENVTLRPPHIPVLNNVDVAAPEDPDQIRDALVRQLTRPVRWTELVGALAAGYGVSHVAEFGPGRVLSGLLRRIDRNLAAVAVHDPATLDAALAEIGTGA